MTTEVWMTVPGFEDYEASSLGRVRSKSRVVVDCNGHARRKRGQVLVTMVQAGKGYLRVNLYRDKRMSQYGVHCIVAWAFFGPPHGQYVNHIDFDVTNNHVDNLEYVTPRGNVLHSARHGRLAKPRGEANPMAKLTRADVLDIAKRIKQCERDSVIAADYAVSRAQVAGIRRGLAWRHVTGFSHNAYLVVRGASRAAALSASGRNLTFVEIEDVTGVPVYATT